MTDFFYQPIFELDHDDTPWRKLTSDGVSTVEVDGREMLRVEPETLRALSREAMDDVSHLLRPGHLAQLRRILDDPEASENDRFVALELLINANIAAGRELPSCQDTGTAIVMGHRGDRVLTHGDDAEWLAHGIHDAYRQRNLRYSQMAPLDMFQEKNTGSNLPAQIEIYSDPGEEYELLFRGQGWGLGQQDVPVPGDQGAAQPRGLVAGLLRREDPLSRYLRLPAVSPRPGGRRYLGRIHSQDGEAGERSLPRFGLPTTWQRGRAGRFAISSGSRSIFELCHADRASVRSSEASTSLTTSEWCGYLATELPVRSGLGVSCSADRQILAREDLARGSLRRTARDEPGPAILPDVVPPISSSGRPSCEIDLQSSDGGDPRGAVSRYPGRDPTLADAGR